MRYNYEQRIKLIFQTAPLIQFTIEQNGDTFQVRFTDTSKANNSWGSDCLRADDSSDPRQYNTAQDALNAFKELLAKKTPHPGAVIEIETTNEFIKMDQLATECDIPRSKVTHR